MISLIYGILKKTTSQQANQTKLTEADDNLVITKEGKGVEGGGKGLRGHLCGKEWTLDF